MANQVPINPEDVGLGSILYLLELGEGELSPPLRCGNIGCPNSCKLDSSGYGHPVAVTHIERDEQGGVYALTVVVITSHPSRDASRYSPIGHFDHPEDGDINRSQYWLEGQKQMRLYCRLRLFHTWTIPCHWFHTFGPERPNPRAFDFRLDEGSYGRLMKRLDMNPGVFIPTFHLRMPPGHSTLIEPTGSQGPISQLLTPPGNVISTGTQTSGLVYDPTIMHTLQNSEMPNRNEDLESGLPIAIGPQGIFSWL